MQGTLNPIMVHLRPNLAMEMPVRIPAIPAPMVYVDPIQEPCSSSKDTGKVQLFLFSSKSGLTLQFDKKGNAGDDHPRPVPSPKAPMVAENVSNYILSKVAQSKTFTGQWRNNLRELFRVRCHFRLGWPFLDHWRAVERWAVLISQRKHLIYADDRSSISASMIATFTNDNCEKLFWSCACWDRGARNQIS